MIRACRGKYLLHGQAWNSCPCAALQRRYTLWGCRRGFLMNRFGNLRRVQSDLNKRPLFGGWNRGGAVGRRDSHACRHDAGKCKAGIRSPDRIAVRAMPPEPGRRRQAQVLRRKVQGERQQSPEEVGSGNSVLRDPDKCALIASRRTLRRLARAAASVMFGRIV